MSEKVEYQPGTFYRICDRTGFKVRAWKTDEEWTGNIIRKSSWERRHPQDLIKGLREDPTVWDGRPRQTDLFVGQHGKLPNGFFVGYDPSIGRYFTVEVVGASAPGTVIANGAMFEVLTMSAVKTTTLNSNGL